MNIYIYIYIYIRSVTELSNTEELTYFYSAWSSPVVTAKGPAGRLIWPIIVNHFACEIQTQNIANFHNCRTLIFHVTFIFII